MTTILHKRGTGIPSADDLSVGEIALDTSTGTAYTKLSNGTVVEIGGSGGDSAGAGMVISKTEPVDKVDGMQWLEADTGLVFIWDEDKWLQFPAGSEGGGSSGGGGGSEWELLDSIDVAGASALDYPNFTDEFMTYRLELNNLYVSTGSNFALILNFYENGSVVYSSDYCQISAGSPEQKRANINLTERHNIKDGLFQLYITFSGVRPSLIGGRAEFMPYLAHGGFGASKNHPVVIDPYAPSENDITGFLMSSSNGDCGGFVLDFNNGSTGSVKSGTANIYGKRD